MTTLTMRAEQALLGALLAEPGQVGVVARYLAPGDFLSEVNGALYASMLELHAGPLTGRPWGEDVAQAAALRSIPTRYLSQLEAACPEPSHGLSYGALVMQARTRRVLGEMAAEMVGRSAGIRASQGADVASAIRAHAWAFDPDTVHASAAPSPAFSHRGAGKEKTVLAALLQRYLDTEQILGLLAEDAFITAQHRQIFRAVKNLHNDGRDIDPLTVDWETARAQEAAGLGRPAGPSARDSEPSYTAQLAKTSIAAATIAKATVALASLIEGRQRVGDDRLRSRELPAGSGVQRSMQHPPGLSGPGSAPVQRM